jgi:hypothetical protein
LEKASMKGLYCSKEAVPMDEIKKDVKSVGGDIYHD